MAHDHDASFVAGVDKHDSEEHSEVDSSESSDDDSDEDTSCGYQRMKVRKIKCKQLCLGWGLGYEKENGNYKLYNYTMVAYLAGATTRKALAAALGSLARIDEHQGEGRARMVATCDVSTDAV